MRRYYAIVDKRTGRIVSHGKTPRKSSIVPGLGQRIIYSRRPVNPEKHVVAGRSINQRKAVVPRVVDNGRVLTVHVPADTQLANPCRRYTWENPGVLIVEKADVPIRLRFQHPTEYVAPIVIPPFARLPRE